MSAPGKGGPAFPCDVFDGKKHTTSTGMTLRDYFAAKAMQGLLASRMTDYENGFYEEEVVATSAYELADAMLKARQA